MFSALLPVIAGAQALPPSQPDPVIQRAVQQVSAQNIQQTIEALVRFNTRNTLSSVDKGQPAGQGILAAADFIEAQFRQYSAACNNCLEVKRDTFTEQPGPRIVEPTVLHNIYAVLKGTDPVQSKRIYLVTGHYDSRASDTLDTRSAAPGANDDASGVAVSLECARILSQLKFPATLVFVAVAGEEQGLNGSRHLAQYARKEGWDIEAVLNNDIVGGNTTPGDSLQDKSAVRIFSEGIPLSAPPDQVRRILSIGAESDSPSRELARAITDTGKAYFASPVPPANAPFHPVLVFRLDRFLRGGDHSSFNLSGFPAVRFTEWREDFNHQHQDVRTEGGVEYGDLLKFVDFNYTANVARLNAATLATLASAPAAPQKVRVSTKNLDNDSLLLWDAPEGASADIRYEILWRSTSAPNWEFARPAGTATQINLPVSKDNVIFGVRSIDNAGHHSPAVTPVPER